MATQNTLTKKDNSFSTFLSLPQVRQKIDDIVGGERGSQFIASIATAVGTTPALKECDHSSILTAALLGEALRLSPSPQLGHFYMVPYKAKNRASQAQFQLGYKGYVQLAIRSGQYRNINVLGLKEGELIRWDELTEEIEYELMSDWEKREGAPTVAYYAYFQLNNGFRKAMLWSKSRMQAHAKKYSQGYASDLRNGNKFTFWSKDFDGMAYKTMLRQLISKWGIMSVEMQKAVNSDMGVIHDDGTVDYVDGADAENIFQEADVTSDVSITQQPVDDGMDGAQLPFGLDDSDIPEDVSAEFFGGE